MRMNMTSASTGFASSFGFLLVFFARLEGISVIHYGRGKRAATHFMKTMLSDVRSENDTEVKIG